MGRKKITIEPIDDTKNRQVTFNKRKVGLMKKAMEIAILCNCKVGLVLFNDKNEMFTYSSEDGMDNILDQYENYDGAYESLDNADLDELVPGRASSFKVGTTLTKVGKRKITQLSPDPSVSSLTSSDSLNERNQEAEENQAHSSSAPNLLSNRPRFRNALASADIKLQIPANADNDHGRNPNKKTKLDEKQSNIPAFSPSPFVVTPTSMLPQSFMPPQSVFTPTDMSAFVNGQLTPTAPRFFSNFYGNPQMFSPIRFTPNPQWES